jgi:hypothetical protein
MGKEEIKLSLLTNNTILYIEHSTESTKSLLELTMSSSQSQNCKTITKLIKFHYTHVRKYCHETLLYN